jgi:hypothetical protein
MQATLLAADEYKASLPTNGLGVIWTMESFSTYINLLYPHVTVKGPLGVANATMSDTQLLNPVSA